MATMRELVDAGYEFAKAFDVHLLCDDQGSILRESPHALYAKRATAPLLAGGEGPFCRFDAPPGLTDAGVYAICADREVRYVGQTMNGLTQRFGAVGYGRIHPRNCYAGGQPTNIRVNAAILGAVERGQSLSVWFMDVPPSDLDPVEDELRSRFSPPWNAS